MPSRSVRSPGVSLTCNFSRQTDISRRQLEGFMGYGVSRSITITLGQVVRDPARVGYHTKNSRALSTAHPGHQFTRFWKREWPKSERCSLCRSQASRWSHTEYSSC